MNKLFPIMGFSFTFVNVLDLILSLKYFQFEVNPLVLANPTFFYLFKMVSIFIVLSWSWYHYTTKVPSRPILREKPV